MYQLIKRTVDFLLSLTAAVVLLPLFLILVILIKLDSKGPVLFGQKRIGKDKTTFMMCKFRTMKIDTPHDMPTHLLENPDQYITRIGKFLRRTSLDELPQIFHIITGKMAIIGPRPALWNQFDLIELRDQYHANDLRPGLTGWAQINGRDELSLEVKAKYDGEYAKHISFGMDVKIFFYTILRVSTGDGIQEGKSGEKV